MSELTHKLIHPSLVCRISTPKLPEVWNLAVQPHDGASFHRSPDSLSKTNTAGCLRTRPLLCELNLWPPARFHLISLEQWSQTSISGMRSLSICCSGELSAEKHWLSPFLSARKMLRTAGCPTERALECRLRLRGTQKREKHFFFGHSRWPD